MSKEVKALGVKAMETVLVSGAAMTKCHRLGGFSRRNVFPPSYGGWSLRWS